ncbi:MAG: hypothetical protein KZQ89_02735 [Candidatus Thiodiazotropha sp. (ex Lucinoma kastoroae)]|nr:hypothetical protein [Candidatus Thiodiazotropha sp. (ex Lucinoma kastoroae)]
MSHYVNRLLPYLFILISAVTLLGANPFKGETVAPTDLLVNQIGWKNLDFSLTTRHPARSDVLDARLPRWIHAKQSIRDGELPIWNPYPINGMPGIQWLPAAILTPAFSVFAAIDDNATGFYFALLTNLLIAAVGAYLLLLSMTGNRLASLFGSIVFAYSGFHAAWFYWAHVTSSIWIPWVFLFAYKYLVTQRGSHLPWFSLALALMIFGGFPSITIYCMLALIPLFIVYTPWSAGFNRVVHNGLSLFLFTCLGFLITLFAIHSLYEMLQFTQAASSRHGGTPLNIDDFRRFYLPIVKRHGDVEQTFYVGLIPLLLLSLSLPLLLLRKFSKNLIFALFLLTLTIAATFSIIPQDYIRAIPTFSTNNWGRMSVLLTIAFAVLAAEILARFYTALSVKNRPNTKVVIAIILITIQFIDLKNIFNNFNGGVPSNTFFPSTPSIEYVSKSLSPLQSVLADRIYLLSGVLANYQLPEWFAHGFRTPSEVNLLKTEIAPNGFISPTAVSIHCEGINFNVVKLSQLGIRYMLCQDFINDRNIHKNILTSTGKKTFPSDLISPTQPLIQHFNLFNQISFDSILLRLATYGRETSYTDVTVKLFNNDILQAEKTVTSDKITDNHWVEFEFPNKVTLNKTNNHLEISVVSNEKKGKISAWLHPLKSPDIYIDRGDSRQEAVLAAKFFESTQLPDKITIHTIEDGLMMLENTEVKGSGYFLAQLDESLRPDYTQVKLTSSKPTSYELHYTGSQAGWLTLPLRHYPGWQSYLNSNPVNHDIFLDMMPAIPVSPGDRVSYRYEPKILQLLAIISLFSLFITLYLIIKLRSQ